MNDVKRYYLEYTAEHPSGGPQVYDADPREHIEGYWVDWDDHEKAIEALQAENEMLKVLLARHNDGVLRLIGLSDKRERVRVGENMLEETPEMMQSVINKLKADAVREFANSTVLSGRVMEEAIIYANKLEAGELR